MNCLNKDNGCKFRYETGLEISRHLMNDCCFMCCDNKKYGCNFIGTQDEIQIHLTICSFNNNNNNNNHTNDNQQQLNKIENIVEDIFNEVSKPPLPPRDDEVERTMLIQTKLDLIEQQNQDIKNEINDFKKQNKELKIEITDCKKQNKELQEEMKEIKQQNQSLENKLDQIFSLLQNIAPNKPNNNNYNNNKKKTSNNNNIKNFETNIPSNKIIISQSPTKNWKWDSSNCGSDLQIISSTKVKKINRNHFKNAHVTGTHKFEADTGLFTWKLKLNNLKNRDWIAFGVARLSDLDFNNGTVYMNTYSWSSLGKIMKNNKTYSPVENKIPENCSSMVVYLELNTNKGQLKTVILNRNETFRYLYHTHPSIIPFPCHPFVILFNNGNEVELIGVNQPGYSKNIFNN